MADQDKPAGLAWERVGDGPPGPGDKAAPIWRAAIPGGWLYMHGPVNPGGWNVVFVPAADIVGSDRAWESASSLDDLARHVSEIDSSAVLTGRR